MIKNKKPTEYYVQNKKLIIINCTKCGYTELYRAETSTGMNIFDLLMN